MTSTLERAGTAGRAVPAAGFPRVAVLVTYLAAFAIPWNGLKSTGLSPGDLLLLLAFALFVAADLGAPWPRLPPWAWAFGAVIVLVTVLHEVLPTGQAYLDGRLVVDPAGRRIPEINVNGYVGAKFLVPVLILPAVFMFARAHAARAVRNVMIAYASGSAVSGVLALAQVLGVSNLATQIRGYDVVAGTDASRSAGLAVHPNFLGMTCVLSLPFTLWLLRNPVGRERTIGWALLVTNLLGVYASGSRGGAAVAVIAIVGSVAVMPTYRRALATVGLLLAMLAGYTFVVKPSIGHAVLKALRLTSNNQSATGSDLIRAQVGAQGVRDFRHSPLDGVGMQVAAEAHNVYLQALAAGGLLLLTGLLVFLFGGLARCLAALRTEPAAYPILVAVVCAATLAWLENSLTDRLAYVPLALCATLVPARRLFGGESPAEPYPGGRSTHTPPPPPRVDLDTPGRS
jgi:hypothetical protein